MLPPVGPNTFIDGYTQPGAHPNTKTNGTDANILIELSGEHFGGGGDGLDCYQSGITVRGLCINRFTNGNAINCSTCCGSQCGGNGGIAIEGCFIGTDTSGTNALPNRYGVVFGCTSSSRIGGPDLSQRNLISGNLFDGIQVTGDHSVSYVTIQNNLIGTDWTGTNALRNGEYGVISPPGGGANPIFSGFGCLLADNVIAASGSAGIIFAGTSNVLVRNKIGVGSDGLAALGNGNAGLQLFGNGHSIGGTNPADANTVGNNNGPGVLVADGTGHAILGNSIFHNAGLAIDLGALGSITNDPGDGDTGPNNLQNYPVLSAAVPAPGSVTLSGTLNSASNTTYRLEFFHSPDFAPAGLPQAATFLGSTNVTTDATGNANFSVTILTNLGSGFITATATDRAGNTSEISDGLSFARLEITRAGAQVRVFWLTNLTTFVLQSNADLTQPSSWTNVAGAPGVTGSYFFRDFNPTGSPLFFRLRSP